MGIHGPTAEDTEENEMACNTGETTRTVFKTGSAHDAAVQAVREYLDLQSEFEVTVAHIDVVVAECGDGDK